MKNFNDPLLIEWHRNSQGESHSVKMPPEEQKLVRNKVFLNQIPDPQYRVKIPNMFETEGVITNKDYYVVDYTNGMITFHEDFGKEFIKEIEYYGRGVILYPASRIYTNLDDLTGSYETLDEFEVEIEEALDTLEELKDNNAIGADRISTLQEEIKNAHSIEEILSALEKLAQETNTILKETTDKSIPIAEDFVAKIAEGETILQELIKQDEIGNETLKQLLAAIVDGRSVDKILQEDSAKAEELIEILKGLHIIAGSFETKLLELHLLSDEWVKKMQNSITLSEEEKAKIDSSILSGKETNEELTSTIEKGKEGKQALDDSITAAELLQGALTDLKASAEKVKELLSEASKEGEETTALLKIQTEAANEIYPKLEILQNAATEFYPGFLETKTSGEVLKENLIELIDLGSSLEDFLTNLNPETEALLDELRVVLKNSQETLQTLREQIDITTKMLEENKEQITDLTNALAQLLAAIEEGKKLTAELITYNTRAEELIIELRELLASSNAIKLELEKNLEVGTPLLDSLKGAILEGEPLLESLKEIIAGSDFEALFERIKLLEKDTHKHNNSLTIDELSEENGELIFKGKKIVKGVTWGDFITE